MGLQKEIIILEVKKMKNGRKVIKRIIALAMITLMWATTTSCGRATNYDTEIIKLGKQAISECDIITGRTYSVSFENGIYTVDINGDIRQVKIDEKDEIKKYTINSIELELPKNLKEVVDSSFSLVEDYVRNSTILQDKETILQEIDKIDVQITESDTVAEYREGVIYIGDDYINIICEWMICHELIHALADITNEGVENEPYAYYQFNEGITDLITYTLKPQMTKGYISGYAKYHYDICLYIGCFEEEAIKAYFYGYEEIWKITGKDAFDFYVESFENMINDEVAFVCVNNSINLWAQN